jgi:hypothetical protein
MTPAETKAALETIEARMRWLDIQVANAPEPNVAAYWATYKVKRHPDDKD